MKCFIKIISLIGLFTISQFAYSASVTDTFATGDTLTADKMTAIKDAVTDNDTRVTANEGNISSNATGISTKQNRVTGDCPPGQSIGAINADGTVTCEVDTDTNTNAGTLCPDNTLLNGDGTCDTISINYPAVSSSGRINTSSSPVFFDETNHRLIVTFNSPNNDYIIYSTTTNTKRVVIDDGTGVTVSGVINTVGATLLKTIGSTRIATIDLIETSSNDKLYRYRCIAIISNLVTCIQEIY